MGSFFVQKIIFMQTISKRGYVLNIFREVIPYMLLAEKSGDMAYRIEAWAYLWGRDILAFSGLTFLFFGIIKKFNIKDMYIFVIWCSLSTVNLIVRSISFESEVANAVFGLLWGTNEYSWFPFLTWIFYPILGYFFAKLLIRCKDKEMLYSKLLIGAGTLSIPLWVYAYINNVHFGAFGELYQETYYHHDLMGNIILGTFALFWISVCFYVVKLVPEKIYKAFARWSKNSNMMYCVHYVILGWLVLVIEKEAQSPGTVMLIATCVFIITDLICSKFNTYNKKRKQGEQIKGTVLQEV